MLVHVFCSAFWSGISVCICIIRAINFLKRVLSAVSLSLKDLTSIWSLCCTSFSRSFDFQVLCSTVVLNIVDVNASNLIIQIPHIKCQITIVHKFNIVDLFVDILVSWWRQTLWCLSTNFRSRWRWHRWWSVIPTTSMAWLSTFVSTGRVARLWLVSICVFKCIHSFYSFLFCNIDYKNNRIWINWINDNDFKIIINLFKYILSELFQKKFLNA